MSNYTKSTNFATKDNLTPGDPLKVVRGTEIDTEYNNIATAIATKTDNSAAAITGGAIDGATVGATTPATGAFTTLAASGTTTLAGALVGAATQSAFNTVSTTLNLGGAATALNLGAATGTATVNNTTLAAKAITASTTLAVTGTSTLTGAVTATAGVSGPITSSSVSITGGSITGITDLAVADGGTGASTAAGGLNNLLPSQTGNASKYLQTDGTNASWDAVSLSTADITGTLGAANGGTGVSNNAAMTVTGSGNFAYTRTLTGTTNVTFPTTGTLATLAGTETLTNKTINLTSNTLVATSAQILAAVTDETGTGALVFANTPTLVSPLLGTPTSGVLSACTGLPISTGVSGLGTGIATALAVNTGSAGAPVLFNGALGTPSGGTLTSCTGLPNAGLVNSSITIGGTAIALGASSNALANDITVYGVTVGRGAGAVATNTAVGNTALGGGSQTGADNSAFGTYVLAANTTGYGNSGFGGAGTYNDSALRFNTTGFANSAFGSGAMRTNTTGIENTAVGNQSLQANISGGSNTAIGRQALNSNTTASNNTAVGYQAAYTNQTGTPVTALGYKAGYSNLSGNNNIFIGYQSGYTNSTASFSVFVGHEAGYTYNGSLGSNTHVGYRAGYLSTGDGNTFVGARYIDGGTSCGSAMTTGSKNTILGSYSGNQDSLDITTGSNYVVLSDGDGNRQITMKEGQTLALDSAVPNAGTGITFPATQSASSNANTLDDYEEGTWTPVATATSGSFTTVNTEGTYTKIGRQVTVCFTVYIVDKGTAAGYVGMTGLPFTSANVNSLGSGAVRNGLDGTTWTLTVQKNSTSIFSTRYDNSTAVVNNDSYAGSVTYFV